MPRPVWQVHGGPSRISTSITAATSSTSATSADVMPYQNWALQVTLSATSTALSPTTVVTLQGTLDAGSTGPTWSTLASWSSTGETSGETVYQTGRPALKARVTAVTNTTSTAHTATLNAWYAGG